MTYTVEFKKEIDFNPPDTVSEVLQNVRTIILTVIGSVPLHRDFGISWECLDKPLPVAKTLLQGAVIDAITDFEKRAKVVSVEFDENIEDAMEGLLNPVVQVEIITD